MSDRGPAGWHPDPRGRHELRYFDGQAWTDHVSDQGATSRDPVNAATPPTPAAGWQPFNKPARPVLKPPGRWARMSKINKAGVIIGGAFVALVAIVAAFAPEEPASDQVVAFGADTSTTELYLPRATTTERITVTTEPTTTAPTTAPQTTAPPTTPRPTTAPTVAAVAPAQPTTTVERFDNCTEMRKKYPNGVSKDHPAYQPKHDSDGDGWACETDESQHG